MRSFEAIRGHLRSKWPILFSIATTSRLWTGTFLPRFLRTWIRYWQMDCCAMFLLISCSVENRRIFKNDNIWTIYVQGDLYTIFMALMGIKMNAKLVWFRFRSWWVISMTSSPNYDVIFIFWPWRIRLENYFFLSTLFRDSFQFQTYFRLRFSNFDVTSAHMAISGLSKIS